MRINDVMSHRPITISPDKSIQDAAEVFLKYGIDGAPVVDENQRLLGMVTELHLYKALAGQQPLNVPVKE
ncbi:MAG TPA: hypothetical protein DER60_05000, partial [Syntrophomonas sp.]|nr:hypothetical protein [Syntrophomonas sp.]